MAKYYYKKYNINFEKYAGRVSSGNEIEVCYSKRETNPDGWTYHAVRVNAYSSVYVGADESGLLGNSIGSTSFSDSDGEWKNDIIGYFVRINSKMYKITSYKTSVTRTGDDYLLYYYNVFYAEKWDVLTKKTKGDYIGDIVAEEGTYPNNGVYGSHWYIKGEIANTPPTVSGSDSNLGDKNSGFLITYQVDDIDTADNLVVTEKLNGSVIRTINGAPRNQNLEIEITNEKLFSLPLNSDNTIEIKVDDQNGGIAYRRYTFRRTNTAPIISGSDEDLGQKLKPFSIDFFVSDNEGNAITVKTYLNNILKEEYQAEDGAINTFSVTKDDWFKLNIGQHSIKIEAIDEHGATAVRNYVFSRYDDKIQFTLKNPIETDIMASKILVTPTWTIPAGAIAKVEACNNGFDEVPTWEDITSQVNVSRHYNFTNDTKTADKWGINIRFTIEKGTATEQAVINGFGGAFE